MPVTERVTAADRETVPNWGEPWEYWIRFAHRYGNGPVSVSVVDDRAKPAAALAVRRWNQAVGMAVFKLVEKTDKADVVIRFRPAERGLAKERGAEALTFGHGGQSGSIIRMFTAEEARDLIRSEPSVKTHWSDTLVHELGHTLGLTHDEGYTTTGAAMGVDDEFDDWSQVDADIRKWARKNGVRLDQLTKTDDPGPSYGEVQRVEEIVTGARELHRKKRREREAVSATNTPDPRQRSGA